jgi:hypothetical protein
MGANAQIAVPAFTAGQILTAAQQTQINTGIPVFATTTTRDAAFGGAGEKTLAQGQFCYLESTGKLQVYTGSAWSNVGSQTQVTRFTASGTFTPPTGVTYAIAHIRGAGAGIGSNVAGTGGSSSVAFASGTITAGGGAAITPGTGASTIFSTVVPANSGSSAVGAGIAPGGFGYPQNGANGAEIVAGGAVTAGVGITVTIGAGGTAGTSGNAGGDGYIWIEYEV